MLELPPNDDHLCFLFPHRLQAAAVAAISAAALAIAPAAQAAQEAMIMAEVSITPSNLLHFPNLYFQTCL